MDSYKEIHLEKPNTLASFLSEEERDLARLPSHGS